MKHSIKIMCDSTCDIPRELAEELDICIMYVTVNIGGKIYHDSIDFTPDEFYQILEEQPEIPVTAAVNMASFKDNYELAFKEGCSDVISVTINSQGASTFSSANLAKQMFFEEHPEAVGKFNIHTVDSRTYSLGFGLPIILAARMRNEGATVDQLLEHLNDWYENLIILFGIYDLRFARKSGRISAASAVVGSLVGVKPIMSMIHGVTENIDRVRGEKNLIPKMVEHVCNRVGDSKDVQFCIMTGSPIEAGKQLERELEDKLSVKSNGFFRFGSAVSVNSGPQCIAVVLKVK